MRDPKPGSLPIRWIAGASAQAPAALMATLSGMAGKILLKLKMGQEKRHTAAADVRAADQFALERERRGRSAGRIGAAMILLTNLHIGDEKAPRRVAFGG